MLDRHGEVLACGDVIATADHPSPGHSVVLGQVALPTKIALQANPTGEPPAAQLFAKNGLLIRPGASLEILVREDARDHASIGWGNRAARTWRLVINGCGATTSTANWLVYAGGYWVAKPTCLPLLVKAGQATTQVSIGVGAPCPGQAPPPPPVAPG